jgi:hypothetical protein
MNGFHEASLLTVSPLIFDPVTGYTFQSEAEGVKRQRIESENVPPP